MSSDIDYRNHPIESILFFDIETVRKVEELQENTPLYDSFIYKMRYAEEAQRKDFNSYNVKALYAEKAALYPEFGKVACITVGKVVDGYLTLYTFKDEDEKTLLGRFNSALSKWMVDDPNLVVCGVNIKFFDLRFIFLRSVINRVPTTKGVTDLTGIKPWLVKALDLTDLFKQSSSFNSPLVCMAEAMGLPSPKSDSDGSQVSDVYYKEGKEGLERIARYCELDVLTTANVLRVFRDEPLLETPPIKKKKAIKEQPKKSAKEKQEPAKTEEVNPLDTAEDNSLVLKRIFVNNEITKEDKKELVSLIGKKRLYKKDKPILIDMIHSLSVNSDMFSKDSQKIIDEKLKAVESLINNL